MLLYPPEKHTVTSTPAATRHTLTRLITRALIQDLFAIKTSCGLICITSISYSTPPRKSLEKNGDFIHFIGVKRSRLPCRVVHCTPVSFGLEFHDAAGLGEANVHRLRRSRSSPLPRQTEIPPKTHHSPKFVHKIANLCLHNEIFMLQCTRCYA